MFALEEKVSSERFSSDRVVRMDGKGWCAHWRGDNSNPNLPMHKFTGNSGLYNWWTKSRPVAEGRSLHCYLLGCKRWDRYGGAKALRGLKVRWRILCTMQDFTRSPCSLIRVAVMCCQTLVWVESLTAEFWTYWRSRTRAHYSRPWIRAYTWCKGPSAVFTTCTSANVQFGWFLEASFMFLVMEKHPYNLWRASQNSWTHLINVTLWQLTCLKWTSHTSCLHVRGPDVWEVHHALQECCSQVHVCTRVTCGIRKPAKCEYRTVLQHIRLLREHVSHLPRKLSWRVVK